MNCSKCNSLNDIQAKFCNNCGSEEPTTTANGNDIQTTKPTEEHFNLAQFKLEASSYAYKDLARNPKEYMDKKVGYRGQVIQVIESGDNVAYRIDITKTEYGYEDTIYVTYKRSKDESRILEDDIVTVWGLSKGLETYQSAVGGQISIPKINALAFELH